MPIQQTKDERNIYKTIINLFKANIAMGMSQQTQTQPVGGKENNTQNARNMEEQDEHNHPKYKVLF